jgi:predicted PurR-regulated permease PerM
MSERLAIRILIGLAIILLGFWVAREVGELLNRFGQVLALFFFAWLISFVLGPPTDALVRVGVRRPLAVLAVYCLSFALLFFGTLLLIPIFAEQLGRLRESVNAYTAQTPAMVTWAEEQARAFGASEADQREFYRSLVGQVQAFTGQVLQNAIGWLTGAAAVLVNVVFCLIISVYMMLDGRRIIAGLLMLVPRRYRGEVRAVLQSINESFGGYIRGQVILSAVYGLAIGLVMWAIGLEFKIISALFAGVALVIPFVGPFISLLPPLLVGLLTRPGDLWWVVLLLIGVQQVVLNVVGPRVFGRTVNMHPLLVIGAALAGAALAGFWGALFGIPVAGIIASAVKRLYMNGGWTGDEEAAPAAGDALAPPAAAPAPAAGADEAAAGAAPDHRPVAGRSGGR